MKTLHNHASHGGTNIAAIVASFLLMSAALLHSANQQDPVEKKPVAVVEQKAQKTPADQLKRINIGEEFPDFTLTTAGGIELKRADFRGRTLVLIYLSAEQRNSERAAADATRVANLYQDRPLDLVFVSADADQKEYFQSYFKQAHISAPLGFDDGHTLYSKLGLIVFPSTLVVGPDGKLKHVILTRRSDYTHLLDAFVSHSLGLLNSSALEQRLVNPSITRSSSKTLAQRHREAARLLRDNELYKGAEQELLLAIGLNEESKPMQLDLADLYILRERYDEAEKLINAILADDPSHRGARLLLGIARFHTGRLKEAEEILLEALVMNPDPERTHYYLGRIYEQQDESQKAIQHYRSALDRMLAE